MTIDAVIFILTQYLTIAIFALAFYGYGNFWDKAVQLPYINDKLLRSCLRIATGMGIFIVGMQIIGIAGLLKKDFIRALVVLGIALVFIKKSPRPLLASPTATGPQKDLWNIWYGAAAALALAAVIATTLHKPLAPPTHWDELMYHLPHVREWLAAKSLTVNEWLRYPYSPYNFNLLYAASMGATGENNSSLMHALAGWLITLLIFRVAQNNLGPLTAVLASVLWISANNWFFETSYVELGVALFVFVAMIYFILWIQDESRHVPLLITSAFFLGMAAGSKYQAAIYPPFFIVAALFYDRRVASWLKVSAAFLAPCIFWYLRNLILTGNPVNPLAGNIFGYHDWNEVDFSYQLYDLKNSKNFPSPEMWLAFLALLSPIAWRNKAVRWMLILSIYSTAIWYFTSHYDRYLVPQYPVLALLGAIGIAYVVQFFISTIGQSGKLLKIQQSVILGRILFGAVLLIFLLKTLPSTVRALARAPMGAEERHHYINDHTQHFGIMLGLQIGYPNEKIYQLGLESALFYGPRRIYGDHFGPWRYRDFEPLSVQDLHKKLLADGFTLVVVNRNNGIADRPNFKNYFSEVLNISGDKAYRVLDREQLLN
ncbi:MAG: hypothetical protein PHU77_02175 [Simplicispira sp.]|nr:hypothetical protein [Simplicispira sp.]